MSASNQNERVVTPTFSDVRFFDSLFQEVNVQVDQMHRDIQSMRTAMLRMNPIDDFGVESSTALEKFRDPIVVGPDGDKSFQVQLDVSPFKLDEVTIKTIDNQLTIHAKHDQKTASSSIYHVFSRQYTLPDGTNSDNLRATLSNDGVLSIQCPLESSELATNHPIAIQKE
ncbi:heat shock protein beta-1-like [Argonauta hians]